MANAILVLNAGSSSIKFTIFDHEAGNLHVRYEGQIEGIGTKPHFVAYADAGQPIHETSWANPPLGRGHAYALERLAAWLDPLLPEEGLIGVGHRVVHGGTRFSAPMRLDEALLHELEAFVSLAPLHQPANLAGIAAAMDFLPGVPNVACFDTAFHRTHPPVADRFAIPYDLYDEGVRRYGFHGLSYEYIAQALPTCAPKLAEGRVVVAHLGNGASMCALKAGRSHDSTMGFTALDGLPMGTRCGQIDPGVLIYLMQEKGMGAKQIEDLLYKRSGLLGLSGVSNDMRTLAASNDPRAADALDYFVYRIIRETGALAASLGGLDGFVFTAGIGENAANIRARVCEGLGWLGLQCDPAANAQHGPRISPPDSPVDVWVIPTDEARMIALHTLRVLV
ncbi:acetate/propionate family kinase [Candidatus Viridilinea mediisalina]|uniref:Acetate kinase n=1 Tax=Candidatus Viridilinea mediisalina TaxID=2024553 RepID=A0A2A6RDP7_9CHLR|nr:acetate kinase [Candidatus Viridilinea mediisalina]PDW00393.1 acetate kinase [Candidatus Viridilinea mediisalina]